EMNAARDSLCARAAMASPLPTFNISDERAVEPKSWLVEGVLGQGQVSVIVAPPSAGKSFLAAHLSGCVGSGINFFDRTVAKGHVLYIAGERATETLKRLKAFADHHGRSLNVDVSDTRLDLLETSDVDRITRTCLERSSQGSPVVLIIIDTLRSLTRNADENSSRDMSKFSHQMKDLAQATGAHVLIVHHSPKGRASEAAGHTALTAMIDVQMTVTKGIIRSWKVVAANDLPDLPSANFQLESTADGSSALMVPTSGRTKSGSPTAPQSRTLICILTDLLGARDSASFAAEEIKQQFRSRLSCKSNDAFRKAWSTATQSLRPFGVELKDGMVVVSKSIRDIL
ncbi:MAG: AAA family ATPase, partial [Solirubrobacteraceae bacterium]|nr:AAA family ATPase [Solirubrobacteraceae bacterium]